MAKFSILISIISLTTTLQYAVLHFYRSIEYWLSVYANYIDNEQRIIVLNLNLLQHFYALAISKSCEVKAASSREKRKAI